MTRIVIGAFKNPVLHSCHSRESGDPGQDPRLRGGDNRENEVFENALIFLILALLIGVFVPLTAIAATATDYKCLKGCIEGGETYTVCMPKCSYASASSQKAHPRMEYSCLKNCMDKGGLIAVCVPHCTRLPESSGVVPKPPAAAAQLPTHDVMKAPVPFNGTLLHTPAHIEEAPAVDYNCLNVCAKGGLEYQLCSERCAK